MDTLTATAESERSQAAVAEEAEVPEQPSFQAAPASQPSSPRMGPSGLPPRVMVVDDERSFRFQLKELLQDEGFDVVGEASDGVEAVELAQSLHPGVILMDLRMPNLGGIEATLRIKELVPDVQVIIFSAYDDPALIRGADEVGAYCYLVKGCRPQLITDMLIQAWIYRRGLVEGDLGEESPADL